MKSTAKTKIFWTIYNLKFPRKMFPKCTLNYYAEMINFDEMDTQFDF